MDGNPKQEVAEKLRSSSSVLVTVSRDPSVDQLASALGLSLMLNKLGKHTTTVFSGEIPNTMEFLDPTKTFDKTVDGLRDFIISLDKEKADKLRYKVEDNVVKIYITPYKSKITDKDLEFSQGDFNVDLVVALGVHKRDDLDNAITSHGRILHDATIVTINSDESKKGNLGAVDWTDGNASCLSEMLVSISEALEGGILDAQMSTAFLTGIVAATERFKNDHTTPKVMTMSAQLMAAGANQQLIANNLQMKPPKEDEPEPKEDKPDYKPPEDGGEGDSFAEEDQTMAIDRDEKSDQKKPETEDKPEAEATPLTESDDDDGSESLEDIEKSVHATHRKLNEEGRTEKIDGEDPAIQQLEDELSHDNTSNLIDLEGKLKSFDPNAVEQQDTSGEQKPFADVKSMSSSASEPDDKPAMGGTFNATSEEAHQRLEDDKNRAINKEILSHGGSGATAHGRDLLPDEQKMGDMPSSEELMHDLEEARRAVEEAMGESSEMGPKTQALNAAPMPIDEAGGDLNLSNNNMAQMNSQSQPSPMPLPQPQADPFGQMNQAGPQQQTQSPMPMAPPPLPQQQFNPPAQQQAPMQQPMPQQPQQQTPPPNPMFNLPQQQPQQPFPQAQAPMDNGGMQQPPQGSPPAMGPPPMPPNAPPPMPPFN